MPEYLPRLKNLFGSGFEGIAYLIAIVFNTVRILPNNHPALTRDTKKQYGITKVIAAAADNIVFKKENIDQIIMFFAIIVALVILFIQMALLAFSIVIPKSYAQTIPENILDFFKTPSPQDDIAFEMLNLTFGIPTFFGGADDVTTPIHTALQALFGFYSYGILIVGLFIFLYLVITIVGETAQSGVPFGKRFNKTWAPIRLILFLGLLLPVGIPAAPDINAAQWITLGAAKMGSGLASQGWILYNDVLERENSTPTGLKQQNVAYPRKLNMMGLPAFMSVVKTCAISSKNNYNSRDFPLSWAEGIKPYGVFERNPNEYVSVELFDNYTYEDLIVESKGKDIHIVFGYKDDELYKIHRANIAPICGSIVLGVTDASQPGPAIIRNAYYNEIINMWNGENGSLYERLNFYAEEFYRLSTTIDKVTNNIDFPTSAFKKEWEDHYKILMEGDVTGANPTGGVIGEAVQAQIDQGAWQMPPEMKNLGWAAAGIWYNKIAEQNGALIAALRNMPIPMLYPRSMEIVKKAVQAENPGTNTTDRFTISFSPNTPGIYITDHEKEISKALNYAYRYWNSNDSGDNVELVKTGNAFLDMVNLVLGTQSLFDMCRNTAIHPLAQLTAVGKSMIDSSISAFGGSALFTLFSLQPLLQSATTALSSSFGTIASIGLLVGFILFYVLPFMPFIYFFFGVGAWVKTIFEAMVAMPLWALAHLRIDGQGIVGDAAIKGYYLIFEIFIRPILIIFGMIASIMIFAVMVKALNQIFHLAVSNLSGHSSATTGCFQGPGVNAGGASNNQVIDIATQTANLAEGMRGPLDEFFFTIIYTILVYMIGTSCFKLIDDIPNKILRWMNAEVSSFADNAGDAAEGLMRYVTLGGSQFGSQLGQSLSGLSGGARETINSAIAGG